MSERVPNMENKAQNGAQRARESAQGTVCNGVMGRAGVLHDGGRQKVRHTKAIRRLSVIWEERIGDSEITAIAIVDLWCQVHLREGGPMSTIVNWSGYTRNWLAKVYKGIREAEQIGALEFLIVPGGKRLCVTEKGHKILRYYDAMLDKVEEEFRATQRQAEGRIAARADKKRKAELIREIRRAA